MTYYEELGLTPAASREEIQHAYRAAARVIHPDGHSDPAISRAATLQLQRLNEVAATLLHPVRRQLYDVSISATQGRPPNWRGARWAGGVAELSVTVLAAISLTVVGVWAVGGETVRLRVDHGLPNPPVVTRDLRVPGGPFLPPTPLPSVPMNPRAVRSGRDVRVALPGVWRYAANPQLYARSMEVVLDSACLDLEVEDGIVRGRGKSLFRGPGLAETQEIGFRFEGPAGSQKSFTWYGNAGGAGTIQLSPQGAATMRVRWWSEQSEAQLRDIPVRCEYWVRKERLD